MRASRSFTLQILIASVYLGAGKLGLLVPASHQTITLVWAPTGIALSAVLLFGYRVLPALAVGAFLTNLSAGTSPAVACAIAAGNTLEAAVAAALLNRVRFRIELDRTRDVLALIVLGAGVSTVASASIGVCALWAGSRIQEGTVTQNWLDWWIGDAMGDLIVAPAVLTAAALVTVPSSRRFARRPLEALALSLATGALAAVAFLLPASSYSGSEIAFIVFPALLAAALRFGPPGAAASSLLTVAIALAGTLMARGPFGDMASRIAIAHLHVFVGTAAVTALLLAASLAEREATLGDLRRSEEAARSAHKMEALGHLAGGIAQEFNNLLTVIQGHASILESQIPLDDQRRESLEEILRASERAAETTKRILAFGRRDGGAPVVLDPGAAVRGLVPVLDPLLERNISLHLEIEPRLPCVRIDPASLDQLILNLVLNARDAMPEGGRLTIRLKRASQETSLDGIPSVELSVIDSGSGMDEPTRRRLFEPYFTTKPKGKGSGLGLATVHSIVTQAGGRTNVWSEPGRGTEFTIRLPASQEASPRKSDVPATLSPATGGHEVVLVVEDDERVWRLVREVLSSKGYEVLVATRGARALELFHIHPGRIALLLVDVDTPDIPGAEIASRAMLARPGLRTLFMSSQPPAEIDEAGIDAARILHKPFSPDSLATRVRRELDAAEPA